jgi:two-component sensor histidine kinase
MPRELIEPHKGDKHGAGRGSVTYKCKDGGKLIVCDEGAGLSANFDPETSHDLEMKIVAVLARNSVV